MPSVRDKEGAMYVREWSGGLLIGCFEPNGMPIFTDGIPKPFEFQLLPEDWDHIRESVSVLTVTKIMGYYIIID